MTDRDALTAAVLANPTDDLPRVVFADWLDETGRPEDAARAAFIRLQIRSAEIAVGREQQTHPPAEWCDCIRCKCERQAVRLFDQWGSTWSPWTVLGAGNSKNWRRGFVAVATGRLDTIATKLPGMLASQPIEQVNVTDRKPTQISPARWLWYSGTGKHLLRGRFQVPVPLFAAMRSAAIDAGVDRAEGTEWLVFRTLAAADDALLAALLSTARTEPAVPA